MPCSSHVLCYGRSPFYLKAKIINGLPVLHLTESLKCCLFNTWHDYKNPNSKDKSTGEFHPTTGILGPELNVLGPQLPMAYYIVCWSCQPQHSTTQTNWVTQISCPLFRDSALLWDQELEQLCRAHDGGCSHQGCFYFTYLPRSGIIFPYTVIWPTPSLLSSPWSILPFNDTRWNALYAHRTPAPRTPASAYPCLFLFPLAPVTFYATMRASVYCVYSLLSA